MTTTTTNRHDDNDSTRHHHHLFNRPPNCQPLSSPPPLYVRGGTIPGRSSSSHLRQPHHHTHPHHQAPKNEYMSPILEMHCYPTSPIPPPPPAGGGVCRKCRLPSVGSRLRREDLSPSVDAEAMCPGCRTGGDANPASADDEGFYPRAVIGRGDGGLVSPRSSITSNNINNIFCTINSQDSLGLVSTHPNHIPLPHTSLPRPHLQPCPRPKGNGSTSPERCPDLVQNGSDVSGAQTNHVIGSSTANAKD